MKLKGEKLLHADMQITEIVIPVKETLAKARSYGVSITVFLTAMLLCSIHEEIPKNRQKRPIALMIPVNLRNYFPSQSMGNFFGWIEVGYTFADETVFQDVLESVKNQFKDKLDKEKVAMDMNGYVRLEKNPLVRAVPLEIKKYFMMAGANLGSRSVTAVYSNIGLESLQVRIPCSFVPVLTKTRWCLDLRPRYRMTAFRKTLCVCFVKRRFHIKKGKMISPDAVNRIKKKK